MLIKSGNIIIVPEQSGDDKLTVAKEAIHENPILTEVLGVLTAQTAKGIDKYPRTVNIEDHSIIGWIDHAVQEQVDMIIYLTALKQKIVEGKK